MHSYSETCVLPYTPEQMFRLVVDIEKYPEFLPWCRAARIVSRETMAFMGELVISFSHLTERYTSRVTPTPPTEIEAGCIDVALVSGPFESLNNHWKFSYHADGCEVFLALDFKFKSRLLDKLIGGMFGRACDKMVAAFTKRAEQLYGKKTASTL